MPLFPGKSESEKHEIAAAIQTIRPTLSAEQVERVMYSLRRVQKVLGDISPKILFELEQFKKENFHETLHLSFPLLSILKKHDLKLDLSKLKAIETVAKGNPETYSHNKWFPVRQDYFKFPGAEKPTDWVIIEGVDSVFTLHHFDDDTFLLNFMVRPGKPNSVTIEISGGRIEKGQTPKEAAIKELQEETGLPSEKIKSIDTFGATNKESDRQKTRFYYFYSKGGTKADLLAQKLEPEENIVRAIVPKEAVWDLLEFGGSLASQGILKNRELVEILGIGKL